MRKVDPIGLAKYILWEEAKGKLRALVAADGAEMGGAGHFEKVSGVVEKFIKEFEEEGHHE
jgi:hypothetical protein